MGKILAALMIACFSFGLAHADVTMTVKPYKGWPNSVYLSNGKIELVVTTDVGPRIISLKFIGGENVFKNYTETLGKTGGNKWLPYGGHRLWHAPEAMPRTYFPDNGPVKHSWDGSTLVLKQPTEKTTGIAKEMDIRLDSDDNHVTIEHRLVNHNPWTVRLAAWALTQMAPGGRAIIPQEPYISHDDYLLPARSITLWHYSNMADPRWTWGKEYIQLRQDPTATTPQKAGYMNKQGWLAYALDDNLFVKRFAYDPKGDYPDYGCNSETYSDPGMLEMETLGPLTNVPPNGGVVEHTEHWFLFKTTVGNSDADIDAKVLPLIHATSSHLGWPIKGTEK